MEQDNDAAFGEYRDANAITLTLELKNSSLIYVAGPQSAYRMVNSSSA